MQNPSVVTRRLILMRHGEAELPGELGDHARPLTPAGRGEAARVADQLVLGGWIPQAVHGSNAMRTRQTWDAMSSRMGAPAEVGWTLALYLPTLEGLIDEAQTWDADATTVLCLGHNPGWSESASRLTGQRVGMGTAYAALLRTDAEDWSSAFAGSWELVDLLKP